MVVWYSLVGSNGKATPDDIMDPAIKPHAGEWYRQGGPDKFLGSTLEATLKQAEIKTVIVCGNSFQGATVGTASGAAQRGYKVVVPVDCSAGEDGIPSRQGRPRGRHQPGHLDAQHDDQVLRTTP
jgi:nicotinamidase-related amidase